MAMNDGFCSQGIVSPPLKPQSPAPSSALVAHPRFKAAPTGPSAAMLLPATRQGCRIQQGSTPGMQSQQAGRGLPPGHGETFQCLPSPPTLPIPITSQLHPSCSSLGSHHVSELVLGFCRLGRNRRPFASFLQGFEAQTPACLGHTQPRQVGSGLVLLLLSTGRDLLAHR